MLARCGSASCSGSTAMSWCVRTASALLRHRNPGVAIYGLYGGPGQRRAPFPSRARAAARRFLGLPRRPGRDLQVAQWRCHVEPVVHRPRRNPRMGLGLPGAVGPGRGLPPAHTAPSHGSGRHAHLGRAARARGRGVVAVDAGRCATRVRRLPRPRDVALRARGRPHVLSIHRDRRPPYVHGVATPASTIPSSGSSSTRSPSTPKPSVSRSSPTRASARGGPRSPPHRAPRATEKLVHAWRTPVRLPVMLYESKVPRASNLPPLPRDLSP